MDRRAFLTRAAASVGATGGLAGCLGRDGGNSGEASPPSAGDDAVSFEEHHASDAVDDQPYFGPAPGTATGTIVAFEDPSCPRCATFERETVPKLRSELVEPGDATFVFRGYPVVYDWGEPATRALEATLGRDETAHWSLLDHYFAEQGRFSADDVLDRTEAFLAGETDLDAAAVVADAREGAYDDQVRADLDAGEAAGAGGVTPTVFLFRDGEYRTEARGSVSFEVVRTALEL